jgi:surfactin synthase thioesterase subunit
LAFEVARILQSKEKRGPAHLIVGAARAPHLERILSSLGHLPDQDFVDAIQNRYSGIPAAVLQDAELMQLFLPVLRADFNAYEGYRFHEGEPLTCPITTFVGSADPVVTADAMAAWKQHTSASFATHTIAGDHFFLTSNRDTLIQIARDILLNPAPDPVDLSPQTMPVQGVRS